MSSTHWCRKPKLKMLCKIRLVYWSRSPREFAKPWGHRELPGEVTAEMDLSGTQSQQIRKGYLKGLEFGLQRFKVGLSWQGMFEIGQDV